MSWCGGGEINPTPGTEWRSRPMYSDTLPPGSWPPSPGLAPCAILIWIWSARRQVFSCHPKTTSCHLFDSRAQRITFLQVEYRPTTRSFTYDGGNCLTLLGSEFALELFDGNASGLPPPSPVLHFPPMRIHCHSERSVRFSADRAQRHSTGGKALDDFLCLLYFCSTGIVPEGSSLNSNSPLKVMWRLLWSLIIWAYSW